MKPDQIAELRRQEGIVPKSIGKIAAQSQSETAPIETTATSTPPSEVSMGQVAENEIGQTQSKQQMEALRAQLAAEEQFRPPASQ